MYAATPRPHAGPATGPAADAAPASLATHVAGAAPLEVSAMRKEVVPPAAEDRAAREGRLSSAMAAGG